MRAMVVDDDLLICKIESYLLHKYGFEAESFTNPLDAIQAFERNPNRYDFLLTDWEMPKLKGGQLIQILREQRPTLPIAIVSGFDLEDKDTKPLKVNCVIAKPFRLTDFFQALNCLCSNPPSLRTA